jgi:hypothetical protein
MNATIEKKITEIKAMTDTQVLVAAALSFSKTYGQIEEDWEYAAGMYAIFSEDQASLKIEDKLGDTYLLDPETSREWLITEAEYSEEASEIAAWEEHQRVTNL